MNKRNYSIFLQIICLLIIFSFLENVIFILGGLIEKSIFFWHFPFFFAYVTY